MEYLTERAWNSLKVYEQHDEPNADLASHKDILTDPQNINISATSMHCQNL